jgi:asparagine synthase (glutamine-hydrolysing)
VRNAASVAGSAYRLLLAMPLLIRFMGPRWLAYRVTYAIQRRSGMLKRRMPAGAWADYPLATLLEGQNRLAPDQYIEHRRRSGPNFFFAPGDIFAIGEAARKWDEDDRLRQTVSGLKAGRLRYFNGEWHLLGSPPAWRTNAITGERLAANRHWSEINEFSTGDIKAVWEPSRFAFVYDLVRAYSRCGDEEIALLFWDLVEDWWRANPPGWGPNWMCGQETTFRCMALIFGFYGFRDSPHTTPERAAELLQLLAVSGDRIEGNIEYALSQRNNHSVSEATGLWTLGLLFPELVRASEWATRGQTLLESLARDLIGDDGSFTQHSFNYHRVMLHDFLWAIRLGELNGRPVTSGLVQRVTKSADLLFQVQDSVSGRVPNYGENDGSLILPLSSCSFDDYRPVVNSVLFLRDRAKTYPTGPWDEDLLWLFGRNALDAPTRPAERLDLAAKQGGYYTLRSQSGFCFTSAAAYRERPHHADMLHADVWWEGINIALDPGTFSYNAPAPWGGAFSSTGDHNTVTVDGLNQMDRRGRFLWLPWATGRVVRQIGSSTSPVAYWEGEHDGYRRLPDPVTHRRGILRLPDAVWVIVDELAAVGSHEYRLHWLLSSFPHNFDPLQGIKLHTPQGEYVVLAGSLEVTPPLQLVTAAPEDTEGWMSPTYGVRAPALSLSLSLTGSNVCLWSILGPSVHSTRAAGNKVSVECGDFDLEVSLQPNGNGAGPIVKAISIDGRPQDL